MMVEWLAPLMFLGALVLIFSGYPVALSLGGTALLFAFIGVETGVLDWHLLPQTPLADPDKVTRHQGEHQAAYCCEL